MIQIDIDADLNWVDDDDRNIAKVEDAAARYKVGDVAIAGVVLDSGPGCSSTKSMATSCFSVRSTAAKPKSTAN